MVSVPVRVGPVVAATVNPTAPLPVPDVAASVIQLTLFDVVHGHPAGAVTATAPEAPADPAANVEGAIANVQPSDCVISKGSPAIVRVPERGGPAAGATVNDTVAEPFPLAPEVMEIQSPFDAAVQAQSALDARTSTAPEPPAAPNDADPAESVYLHSDAACVIWARDPFSMMPPVRTTGSPFGAAATSTVPFPCPERPAVMLSQASLASAVHGHSRSAFTAI